jgi:hypothetical protein
MWGGGANDATNDTTQELDPCERRIADTGEPIRLVCVEVATRNSCASEIPASLNANV